MTNPDYDSDQTRGHLVFKLRMNQYYYIFTSPQTQTGDYAEIKQGEITRTQSKHVITASSSLIVLRGRLIVKLGGLDEVVRQIREGTFQLSKQEGGEQK